MSDDYHYRTPLLLADGEPVRCSLYMQDFAPIFWTRCERDAVAILPESDVARFRAWRDQFPQSPIMLSPGSMPAYLCEDHLAIVRECVV